VCFTVSGTPRYYKKKKKSSQAAVPRRHFAERLACMQPAASAGRRILEAEPRQRSVLMPQPAAAYI
jgi:hypothetical protein